MLTRMKRSALIVVSFALIGCAGSSPKPPDPEAPLSEPSPDVAEVLPVKRYDARTLFSNTAVAAAGFSHDGTKVLVSSDKSGAFNLYALPVAGGEPERLTTSAESQWAVSYFPSDDRVLYTEDKGGDEIYHLYVRAVDGTTRDVTPGDAARAGFLGWSGDGKHFWVTTTERDPKAADVYRYATDDYRRTLVYTNKDAWEVSAVSRDGRWLALAVVHNNANSDIYLVDLTKKGKAAAPKLITKHDGNIRHQPYAFSPDGKRLWYATDARGEFEAAWSYELASGKHQAEIEADWDVMYATFSERGRFRASAINQDARTVLRVVDTQSGADVALPALPSGDVTGAFFSKDERSMGFLLTSDRAPNDVWVVDLATPGAAPRQLTRNLNPAIDPADLVDGEVVRYPSFDGLAIPAILYRPKGAAAARKAPAIVMVHGGPGGQARKGYDESVQHLVNHGYAVLDVNNRGSSGYGKTFFHMDDKRHGDVDLQDCIHGRRYLEGLDWVDGKRVAIMGGSYGGYMVGAALAFAPDAFDAGIDIFGVMNWVRTLESIPPWWASFREYLYAELGDPATDAERLKQISPLFHAKNIRKPLLVVQGANDPRVLKVESDEIVAAVKANNVPVDYLVFDDEGHGFTKLDNRVAAQETYLRFLSTHLAGGR